MKDIEVKKGSKEKSWAEVEVYFKLGENTVGRIIYRFSAVNGLLSHQQIGNTEHGILCENCSNVMMDNRADGQIRVKGTDRGLCSLCASSQEIYKKYIIRDDHGEYALISKPKKR